MMALIAWTAHSSWQRTGELREKLTAVQLQSFQIADHLQQTIWELNNLVLRYGAYHDTNDWAHFDAQRKKLDRWIDDQRPVLFTEKEKQVLDLINTNYDYYMDAALQIEAKVRANPQSTTHLGEFANLWRIDRPAARQARRKPGPDGTPGKTGFVGHVGGGCRP
jgi:hypothetical protein